MTGGDFVTVLTTAGPLMTKRVMRGNDGRAVLRDYDDAKHFDFEVRDVTGLAGLAAVLDRIGPRQCVVLGRPIDGAPRQHARRLLRPDAKTGDAATLEPATHCWLPIDLDAPDCPPDLDPIAEPERAVEYVAEALLPAEMSGADVYWNLTSGAGFKPGIRLRLVFWLDRAMTGDEVKRWLAGCRGVDGAIYAANQPIFFARPLFDDGVADPVPRRSGIRQGERRLVSPPALIPEPARLLIGGGGVGGTSVGYEALCRRIGDHRDGEGFFAPIKSAAACWIATNGAEGDAAWLRADMERVIRDAPRDRAAHPDSYIETRVRDLDSLIPRIVGMQAAEEAGRKPEMKINTADLTETARAIGRMLAGTGRVFVRDTPTKVVPATHGDAPVAAALTANNVVIETHRLAQPVILKSGKWVATTLPERIAKIYLDMRDEWNLPGLDGITTAPLLSGDGAIRAAEGYDPGSRLWAYRVPAVVVPDRPNRGDAEGALRRLRATFRTFAFADARMTPDERLGVDVVDSEAEIGDDESAALIALLTAVCRASVPLAPGLVVTAPQLSGGGVGKGLLVRAICIIAHGLRPKSFTGGHGPAELDKRIVAEAIKASPALFLDNVNGTTLASNTLASLLTERPACVRVLGETRSVELNSASFVAVTGNGLVISEDLARRFLTCELDAKTEDPELRPFRVGFLDDVEAARADLLTAVLTVWRWGRQNALSPGKPLGSFELWAAWARDPLVALGCRDPVARIATIKGRDPRRQGITDLFALWWSIYGDRPVATGALSPEVTERIDPQGRGRQFVAARLSSLANARGDGFVMTRQESPGKWGTATYALKDEDGKRQRPEKAASSMQKSLILDDAPIQVRYGPA